jgi:hypothetical protein
MQRIPLNLNSVRAARELRAGANPKNIGNTLGMSLRTMERIETAYEPVPDALLAGIERLLNDREKLRRLVSTLMHRYELLP